MSNINLTINGIPVVGKSGQTILDVARENQVHIPTLCHDDRLKPFGSCLLCRVEVEGARGTMLACGTEITEGMIVRTESPSIDESRKTCLELLVSQHYGDCIAPCSMTCPAGIDVQGYIAHIANGQYKEAVKLIKEKNPLPVVCGRVCTRPCEDECRRNLVDERVGIDYLKRFAADYDLESGDPYIPETKPKTGKKAAIIGAGPAGLSCAFYLAKEGHEVKIYERWPRGGGMLRYGIPEYRMPKEVLDKEIETIKSLGVEIQYNTTFGKDITYDCLKKEGFEAIFLAVGSQIGQPIGCEGESCTLGVFSGVDFLSRVQLKNDIDLKGKKVVVIGGGNTAIDAARTAVRLGADKVVIAYRRTKQEMPAHKMEIEEAEHEGVELQFLIAPNRIMSDAGKTLSIEFIRMELGEPDSSGRRRPEPVPGSEFIMPADIVIGAIGQTQDLSFIDDSFRLAVDKGRISVDKDYMTTNIEGVFAGGDAVTGPQTAIKAIAAGRAAAYSMDNYLRGQKLEKVPYVYNHEKGKLNEIDKFEYSKYEKIDKEKMPMLSKEERVTTFKEVELGFSEEQARREAARCLSCGCKDVNECKLREYATQYKVKQTAFGGEIKKHPIDESHPFIIRDKNKCIMCGRCVRICLEVQGAGALGYISRGYNTTVEPSFGADFGEDSRCESCGQCVSTCPVGALTEKVKMNKPGPFKEDSTETICSFCGTGCTIKLNTSGDKYIRTVSEVKKGINNGNLCKKGRFGNDFINAENRLTKPLIKKDGKLTEATWEEAYAEITKNIKRIIDLHGENSIGVFVSQRMTNEECYLAQKIARVAMKTNQISSFGRSKTALGLWENFGTPCGTATFEDIKEADFIACMGFDIKEDNPVAALLVKEAAEKGARLVLVHDSESKLSRYASQLVKIGKDNVKDFADAAIRVIKEKGAGLEEAAEKLNIDAEEIVKFAQDYKNAHKPLIIISGNINKAAGTSVGNLALSIDKVEGSILLMHGKCNTQGALDMGCNHYMLPGYVWIGSEEASSFEKHWNSKLPGEAACDYKLKGSVVFAEDPVGCGDEFAAEILMQNEFMLVCDILLTETAKMADVVLPFVPIAETSGTFTNSERRVQKVNKALEPKSGKENYEIIIEIAKALGIDMRYNSTDEVYEEIKSFIPQYRDINLGETIKYVNSIKKYSDLEECKLGIKPSPFYADIIEKIVENK